MEMALVEFGPRFVMTPIVIFDVSFSRPVIYENREYVSPNVAQKLAKKAEGVGTLGGRLRRGRRDRKDGRLARCGMLLCSPEKGQKRQYLFNSLQGGFQCRE
jgi:hypothetical protein